MTGMIGMKKLTVILVLVLAAALLTACGSEGTKETTQPALTEAPAVTEAPVVTEEDVQAKYEDGVLTITLPKKEAKKVPEKKQILIA